MKNAHNLPDKVFRSPESCSPIDETMHRAMNVPSPRYLTRCFRKHLKFDSKLDALKLSQHLTLFSRFVFFALLEALPNQIYNENDVENITAQQQL